jgi:hypothetical protein
MLDIIDTLILLHEGIHQNLSAIGRTIIHNNPLELLQALAFKASPQAW